MRKLLTLFLLLMAVAVDARQISTDEAAAIASEFLNSSARQISPSHTLGVKRARAKSDPDVDQVSPYYVFNADDSQGFVIVSGDDRAKKILGYSDSGNFDFDNMPPALEWFLSVYVKCIDNLNSDVTLQNAPSPEKDWVSISPLLTTKWNQGEPYNDDCPLIDGYHAPTGCVATAIAQIVNYHKWPDIGEGSFSYRWDDKTLSYHYNSCTFNWSIIPDMCDEKTPKEDIKELAKLMSACGIGLEMYYTAYASGSGIAQAKRFLLENMKYSDEMRIVWPYNYSASEWRQLIYNELLQNRPVYMEGSGHAFVCDGYKDSGYYHFNWGWGGEMDGYFILNDLTPADCNYWIDLKALINIKKRNTEKALFTYDLYNSGGLFYDNNAIHSGYIWNPSRYAYNGLIGVDAINITNGESTLLPLEKFCIDGATPDGIGIFSECKQWSIPTNAIRLPHGMYRLYPVYERYTEKFCRLPILAGAQEFVELIVDTDGNHTFTNPVPSFTPDIEISEIAFVDGDNISSNDCNAANTGVFSIKYLLNNHSDYPIPMPTVTVKNELGKEIISADELPSAPCEPNKSSEGGFTKVPVYMRPGKHTMTISDFTGRKLVEDFEFTVLGPGSKIEIEDIKNLSMSYGTSISAMELILTMNTPWVTNIPCIIKFYQQGELKYEVTAQIDGYSDNDVRLILPVPNEQMLRPGEYEISFFDSNYNLPLHSTTLKVIVPQSPVLDINLTKELIDCHVGDKFEIEYTLTPSWLSAQLIWESSNESVASVDENGIVTALSPGETTITVKTIRTTDGAWLCKYCSVSVIQVLAESVSVDPNSLCVHEGDSFSISAMVLPENTTDKSVSWTSSNPDVATVDADGNVNVLKDGQCIITATTLDGSELSAACIITSQSGIETIFADADAEFDVYDVRGVLIKKSCRRDYLKTLSKGTYILRYENIAGKLIIR